MSGCFIVHSKEGFVRNINYFGIVDSRKYLRASVFCVSLSKQRTTIGEIKYSGSHTTDL